MTGRRCDAASLLPSTRNAWNKSIGAPPDRAGDCRLPATLLPCAPLWAWVPVPNVRIHGSGGDFDRGLNTDCMMGAEEARRYRERGERRGTTEHIAGCKVFAKEETVEPITTTGARRRRSCAGGAHFWPT